MKILVLLLSTIVGVCSSLEVPEPKEVSPLFTHSRNTISEVRKQFLKSRQVIPQPKQSRTCNQTTSVNVGTPANLTSPNYPENYPNNYDSIDCFASPTGTRMNISCGIFNIEYQPRTCGWDKLYMSLSGDLEFKDEVKFCEPTFPSQISTRNFLPVGFHTDWSVTKSGFECTISVVAECTSRIELTSVGQQVQIKSPNSPNFYPNNFDSIQCFSSPAGTTMSLICSSFDLESQQDCAFDKLYLSLSGDLGFRDEKKFCGTTFSPQTSTVNSMVVGFHTDWSIERPGYICTVTAILSKACTAKKQFTRIGEQTQITSPGYPNPSPNNVDIVYCFNSPLRTQMDIRCDVFDLEYNPKCKFDNLTVSTSGDLSFSDGITLCSTTFTPTTSISNQMAVSFQTDSSGQSTGYRCSITCVSSNSTNPPPPTTISPVTNTTCQCGVRNLMNSRIINGTVAMPHEFPWRCHTLLSGSQYHCGCTIISPNWILTAGHCIPTPEVPMYVVVGAHNRSSPSERQRTIRVDRIVLHEAYNNGTAFDNDIALLHLRTPLNFNYQVSPVCLPWHLTTTSFVGALVTASGWGITRFGTFQNPDVLMKVDLHVISNQQCSQYYRGEITNNMLCTLEPGKDACTGDSGGGIDYKDFNKNRYYEIGIVSWGKGCAEERRPGVYAKVTNYLSWIESKTQGEMFCRA